MENTTTVQVRKCLFDILISCCEHYSVDAFDIFSENTTGNVDLAKTLFVDISLIGGYTDKQIADFLI